MKKVEYEQLSAYIGRNRYWTRKNDITDTILTLLHLLYILSRLFSYFMLCKTMDIGRVHSGQYKKYIVFRYKNTHELLAIYDYHYSLYTSYIIDFALNRS